MGKFSKMHCAKNPFKFKVHKMYKGDEVVIANTNKEHKDLGKKGYGHTPPPTKLKDLNKDGEITKADHLVKLGKLNADGSKTSSYKKTLKPCQKTAAKRKFDVYPSAYANMWASGHKC